LKTVWTKLTLQLAWGLVPDIAVSPRFLAFQRMSAFAAVGRSRTLDALTLTSGRVSRRKWIRLLITFAAVVCLPRYAAAEVRVFVTNEKSNDVTVIRGSDNQVIQTITVGKRPRGIAAAADGLRVYVANSDSNNVSVIDTRTLQVLDTLPAGVDPQGMAIDARGRLYAVNEKDAALTIIDPATREIVQRLSIGTEPETAVASPNGKLVAVSNETSHDIYLYDTAAGTLAGKVEVPKNPRGMRFTADSRRLYVASEQAHVVSIVDVAKQQVLQTGATGGQRPVDIIISPDGARLYVSHGGSGEVRILDSITLKPMTTIPTGPQSWWMARTFDHRFIYVTVGRANEVVVIDTMADAVAARIPAGTLPWGVAVVAGNF
jgi:YVTN family beta-propeller protein